MTSSWFFLSTLTIAYLLYACTGLFETTVGVLATATSFSRYNPMWLFSMGVTSTIRFMFLLFTQVSRNWGTNQNGHWNHHYWHATNSSEWTPLSCWCPSNHKGCTYRAPVRYVTKTWSAVLLNKTKHIYSYLTCIVYDKLLKPGQSFRIILYFSRKVQSKFDLGL